MYATLTIVQDGPVIRHCTGRVLGRSIVATRPDYVRDVVVLRALQSLRCWIRTETKEHCITSICVRETRPWSMLSSAGLTRECAHLNRRLRRSSWNNLNRGEVITSTTDWLRANLSLCPFYLPETLDDEERIDIPTKQILILAEHFRTFVIPAQYGMWLKDHPTIPCPKQEIKLLLEEQQHADERRALDQPQALGSESARIIKELDLTRAVIAEVMNTLKDERNSQVTLFTILSATRFRTFVDKQMHPTVCPRPGCTQRDSFWHLVDCNKLRTSVDRGADSALFLVHLARTMHIDSAPRPWYPDKSELSQTRP